MSWDGFIGLGTTDTSLDTVNFVETSYVGYTRQSFSFRDAHAAQVQGGGPDVIFTTTDPLANVVVNAYGFFADNVTTFPTLVYPLVQPTAISVATPLDVNPYNVGCRIPVVQTYDGLPVNEVGMQAIAGIDSYFVNSQGTLVFDHPVVMNQQTTLVNAKGTCPTYNINAPAGWYKIGRYLTTQTGDHLKLSLHHGSGYSSNPLTSAETFCHFKTSDGSTVDANGFAGDAVWWRMGTHPGSVTGFKIVSDVAGNGAQNYNFFINSAGGFGVSTLTVEYGTGSWFNEQTGSAQSDPGAASSTVCVPDERWTVLSLPSMYGLSQIGSLTNDAAAAAAGFPVGAIYHTAGALKVRLT